MKYFAPPRSIFLLMLPLLVLSSSLARLCYIIPSSGYSASHHFSCINMLYSTFNASQK